MLYKWKKIKTNDSEENDLDNPIENIISKSIEDKQFYSAKTYSDYTVNDNIKICAQKFEENFPKTWPEKFYDNQANRYFCDFKQDRIELDNFLENFPGYDKLNDQYRNIFKQIIDLTNDRYVSLSDFYLCNKLFGPFNVLISNFIELVQNNILYIWFTKNNIERIFKNYKQGTYIITLSSTNIDTLILRYVNARNTMTNRKIDRNPETWKYSIASLPEISDVDKISDFISEYPIYFKLSIDVGFIYESEHDIFPNDIDCEHVSKTNSQKLKRKNC